MTIITSFKHIAAIFLEKNKTKYVDFIIIGVTISEIRLADGSGPHEGRVEVRVDNGNEWGTLCDDNWGHEQANAICRYLGYVHAEAYTPGKRNNGFESFMLYTSL